MENSNKLCEAGEPDITGLGTRMTAERACDFGSLDRVRLDRERRRECQTWKEVRGESNRV
jgi:hypothetical protein